jgi:hypothetical protein
MSLLTDAIEKGLVIFGEQRFRLLEASCGGACHDGLTDERSKPVVLPVQPRKAHPSGPSVAPDAEHMAAPTNAAFVRKALPNRSRPHMAQRVT